MSSHHLNLGNPPDPDNANNSGTNKPSHGSSSDTFMGISLRGWAITGISLVALLTAIGYGFCTVYAKYQSLDTKVKTQGSALVQQSQALKAIGSETIAKANEASKHQNHHDSYLTIPIPIEGDTEIVKAEFYPIDGCVHVLRRPVDAQHDIHYGNDQDVWILDPNYQPNAQNQIQSGKMQSKPRIGLGSPALSEAVAEIRSNGFRHGRDATVQYLANSKPRLRRAAMYQGSCLNPHPGNFTVRNVQINECVVQVWRQFNDGCTHNQLYNACNGQWDPRINWTFCAFQHHP
jgi:hypothetical protein